MSTTTRNPTAEEVGAARALMLFLESRIRQIENERLASLSAHIRIGSQTRVSFYATDETRLIQVKQDAVFVCHGIVLLGNQSTPLGYQPGSGGDEQLLISIEEMGDRNVTQGLTPPVLGLTQRDMQPLESLAVPLERFSIGMRTGPANSIVPDNVDYWYTLPAEWVIPKGTTLRCLFYPTLPSALEEATKQVLTPHVILVGEKVFR